ncbi:hypothetical protein G6F37_010855 [Rhizopus arrhizus]|nr:hypothetical protein G6F38_011480 [Rhizopus arrhizus]KAG1152132.1 hypothetical protein G6F37_010855 [Rhizopus arrhizus]
MEKVPIKQTQVEEFKEIDNVSLNRPTATKENTSLFNHDNNQTNMTRDQIKYCGAIMRNLKKHRDATPFLQPVDYIKLNIPDYPKIIHHPMDLATVDKKLNSGQYSSVDQWICDVRLVFNNCFKFNGPEATISMLCQNVESAFEKSLRQMPPSKTSEPSRSPYVEYDKEEGSAKKKQKTNSKETFALISEDIRPKRKAQAPTKEYPEIKRNPRKNDAQLKFCVQALKELKKSKYRDINYPFLHPVDVVALNIPDYVDIIKHPMDLSTIEKKLNDGEYVEPKDFEEDIKLMFNNCYLYNPPSLPIHKMGRQLEKVFDEKWAQKPPKTEPVPLVDDAPEEEFDEVLEQRNDSDDERDQKIAELERHIATISQQIASIKSQKRKKPTEKARRASTKSTKEKKTSIPKEKKRRTSATNKTKERKEELPEFTFDQKKDLSERINNLQGDQLNTVVDIIRSSMPNLDGQGQEEIVLDIDSLDRSTLHRLHEFVTGESLLKHHKKSSLPKKQRNYGERTEEHSSSESGESGSESGSESDDSASSSD